MQVNLETILNDIYELEPSLEGEAEAVREIVTLLIEHKPHIVPDAAFAARLRAELMQGKMVTSPASKPSGVIVSPGWMWYAAPVGAFALLLLMLVPKYVHSPVFQSVPKPVDETAPTVMPMQMQMSEPAADAVPGAATKRMVDPAAESVMDVAATSLMMEPTGVPVDTFYIPTQLPGDQVLVEYANVSAPAFLVIYKGDPDRPIRVGVSGLIMPGYRGSFMIPLTVTMSEDATFFAAIYHDEADGVFDPKKDTPVTDDSGFPLYQWFSTIPSSL